MNQPSAATTCCRLSETWQSPVGSRLPGRAAVRNARRQQPTSLGEPPLLHDSLSGADYSYGRRSRAGSPGVVRLSSISEPDYYL